jgi:hypothetical protein
MKTTKQLKLAERVLSQQQQIVVELQALVSDIERCEKTLAGLKQELESVSVKHAQRKTTQEDIAYLEDLLSCAKRKLVWEKQMASLQKRTPALMERVEMLVNHPESSPDEQTRSALLSSLLNVRAAMDRLSQAKV